jgi:hypothetical protein
MLEALSCLTWTGSANTLDVHLATQQESLRELDVHLATQQESLREFELLRALASKMTVAEFGPCVANAFFLRPKELLDTELNRNVLTSTVQHDLFDGNPEGWSAYVAHMQKKVR